jgi:hypothetical protein
VLTMAASSLCAVKTGELSVDPSLRSPYSLGAGKQVKFTHHDLEERRINVITVQLRPVFLYLQSNLMIRETRFFSLFLCFLLCQWK